MTHSRRTVMFLAQIGLPKWPLASISKIISKKKVEYWSEMARYAFESNFRSSKMVAGSHFVNFSLPIRKWFSVIQNGHRRPFWKKNQKQSWILIWNGEKCIRKWFSFIQNVRCSHFVKFLKKTSKLCIDLKWREMWLKAIFGHPKWPLAAILWRKKSCILIWNGEKCDQKPFCEK